MITTTNTRRKQNETFPSISFVRTNAEAYDYLVSCELGFGGEVTEMTGDLTKLVVVTNVLGCKDTTTFEGPVEDMRELLLVASAYEMVRACQSPCVWSQVYEALKDCSHNTLVLTQFGPLLAGQSIVGHVLKNLYDLPVKMTLKEMIAAGAMIASGESVEDVRELCQSYYPEKQSAKQGHVAAQA